VGLVSTITTRKDTLMTRKRRIITAAGATIVAFGASTAVAIGVGNGDSVSAETTGPAVAAPVTVARIAQNAEFAEFGVRADQAKAITAPAAARTSEPWYVVPADRGACFSPGDGGLVCGTSAQLKAGRILAVDKRA